MTADVSGRPVRTDRRVRFGVLDIVFDEGVLEPRAWTLAQSRWAAELLLDVPVGPVLEMFAGVGHIGLAAVVDHDRDLVLVDLNPAACDLARRNVAAAEMGERVEVRQGFVDEVLMAEEAFSLIIADPPWVASSDVSDFPDDLPLAIDGGDDGLDLARTACDVINRHLAAGGTAVLQLGTAEQVGAVADHLREVLCSDLTVVETRAYERGVLIRLVRRPGRQAG